MMDVYYPAWVVGRPKKSFYKINPMLSKYRDFYSKALVVEATYNMELKKNSMTEYEAVLYFNYKNFTNP